MTPELERPFTCTNCRQTVHVFGHWTSVNPDTYVGVACGCRKVKSDAQLKADAQVEWARRTANVIPF